MKYICWRRIRDYAGTSQFNDILGGTLVNLAGYELAVADARARRRCSVR
jgi:hypothetical protein